MKNRDEIYNQLVEILIEEFKIERSSITLEANLFEDLDFDSIDSVDLILILQDLTNTKIKLATFQSVLTIKDAVDAVEQIISK